MTVELGTAHRVLQRHITNMCVQREEKKSETESLLKDWLTQLQGLASLKRIGLTGSLDMHSGKC